MYYKLTNGIVMNLTNNTIIDHDHHGAFNKFWSVVADGIFVGIPILMLVFLFLASLVASFFLQVALLVSMVIRPEDPNSVFNPNAVLDRDTGLFEPIIIGATKINRLFGDNNDRTYMLARIFGYMGGFAASGHIINNMNNDDSLLFLGKSISIFEGMTLAGAVTGNYLLGKPLEKCANTKQCSEFLTRFKNYRSEGMLITPAEETDEMTLLQMDDEENQEGNRIVLSNSTTSSTSTLSIT